MRNESQATNKKTYRTSEPEPKTRKMNFMKLKICFDVCNQDDDDDDDHALCFFFWQGGEAIREA